MKNLEIGIWVVNYVVFLIVVKWFDLLNYMMLGI